MKKMKSWLTALLLLTGKIATAETDLLNLSAYTEGSKVAYGENMVVNMIESTGEKYVTAAPGQSGTMKFPVNLAGEFELTFQVLEYSCCTKNFELFLNLNMNRINFIH